MQYLLKLLPKMGSELVHLSKNFPYLLLVCMSIIVLFISGLFMITNFLVAVSVLLTV